MEPVITAKVIETAQKVYETAKKIEKVVNVSKEMKSVAESEGKDQLDASTKLASEGRNLINNETGKTGEKPKLDNHGPLNKDISLTSKENSSLINGPEPGIKGEKVNLWGEGIPTKIGETEVDKEVFCPKFPEKEGNLLSSNNSIVEEKAVKASSEVDKGPELETTEKRRLPKSGGYWEGVEGDSKLSELGDSFCELSEAQTEDGFRRISTRNEGLNGATHPVTGVHFEEKVVETDTGERVVGVFPEFESVFDARLPEELKTETDAKQFEEAQRQLKRKYDSDPDFREQFSERAKYDIENGNIPPYGYTWHHNEEIGKMQLVDYDTHQKTGHTGGKTIWGGGNDNR